MQDFLKTTSLMLTNQILPVVAIQESLQMAFLETPRHEFVLPHFKDAAYMDGVMPCSKNRNLMPPALLARCLSYLHIDSCTNVLHLGCASGYTSALLAKISRMVTAVDKDGELLTRATQLCQKLNLANVRFYQGNSNEGFGENQPYRAIFVETPSSSISEEILNQLAPQGRCVALISTNKPFIEIMVYQRTNSGIAAQSVFKFEQALLIRH
ncbi:MAG: methyltransferase domain-containing protein [Alphaproteobacteria bacterium]|nr:methyltransferase domain-containing protein [Alphaproteobacteria bacterium]